MEAALWLPSDPPPSSTPTASPPRRTSGAGAARRRRGRWWSLPPRQRRPSTAPRRSWGCSACPPSVLGAAPADVAAVAAADTGGTAPGRAGGTAGGSSGGSFAGAPGADPAMPLPPRRLSSGHPPLRAVVAVVAGGDRRPEQVGDAAGGWRQDVADDESRSQCLATSVNEE